MGLLEIWRGSVEEREARATANHLKGRIDQGRNLSASQQRSFESSSAISRRLTRRRFLIGSGAVIASVAVLGEEFFLKSNGGGDEYVHSDESSIDSVEKWRSLSARERLNRLWANKAPEIADFDGLLEVTQASAEFYCSQVPSKFSPDGLVAKTHFVKSKKEYVDLALEKGSFTINDPEVAREDLTDLLGEDSSAFTTPKYKEVFVNLQFDQERIAQAVAASPSSLSLNVPCELLKAISADLFHEYGHVNEVEVKKPFDKAFHIEPLGETLEITGLAGINFDAFLNINSEGAIVIHSNEALIDAQAYEISRRAGNSIINFEHNRYDNGRQWVSQLSRAGGISFDEGAKYITGDLPLPDLFFKWGGVTTNGSRSVETRERRIEKGREMLAIIGLEIDNRVDTHTAYSLIMGNLSPIQTGTFELPLIPITPIPSR